MGDSKADAGPYALHPALPSSARSPSLADPTTHRPCVSHHHTLVPPYSLLPGLVRCNFPPFSSAISQIADRLAY